MTDSLATSALADLLAERLAPVVREAVVAATNAALAEVAPRPPTRLLDAKAVAQRLGCSIETVRRLHARGVLPAVTCLGRLRFREEDLAAVLLARAGGDSNGDA